MFLIGVGVSLETRTNARQQCPLFFRLFHSLPFSFTLYEQRKKEQDILANRDLISLSRRFDVVDIVPSRRREKRGKKEEDKISRVGKNMKSRYCRSSSLPANAAVRELSGSFMAVAEEQKNRES